MFHVWISLDLRKADDDIRAKYGKDWIDLSGVPSEDLAEQAETLLSHKTEVPIYLGFLEPLHMLSPYHETRLRPLFRNRTVIVLCSNPSSLTFAWKNGIDSLTIYEAVTECPS